MHATLKSTQEKQVLLMIFGDMEILNGENQGTLPTQGAWCLFMSSLSELVCC